MVHYHTHTHTQNENPGMVEIVTQPCSTNMCLTTRQGMQQTLHQQGDNAPKTLTYKPSDNST